jgi:hypothetical protein
MVMSVCLHTQLQVKNGNVHSSFSVESAMKEYLFPDTKRGASSTRIQAREMQPRPCGQGCGGGEALRMVEGTFVVRMWPSQTLQTDSWYLDHFMAASWWERTVLSV